MQRTLVKNLPEHIGKQVLIKGFVHKTRSLGKIAFLILRERTGLVQIVTEEAEVIAHIETLGIGSCLEIEGTVSESNAKARGVEIQHPKIRVRTLVKAVMPIEINKKLVSHSEQSIEHRALALRNERFAAIFKIQGVLAQAYREFMIQNGCTEFFGPAMTASSSEGGAEVFKLPYFGGEATLAQSNQLYKQIMVGVYERVFGIAKWFRAENSHTRRHLTEGHQFEFEMGFIESQYEVMDMLEAAIRFMVNAVKEKCDEELAAMGFKLPLISKEPFPRLKFSEVKEILRNKVSDNVDEWNDMTTEGEKLLCQYSKETYGCEFVFITNFKKGVFYAYQNESGEYENFDLLCREFEIVSGGRRIEEYEKIKSAIKNAGMEPSAFQEYLSIFKYGMPPHGGFGLGLERLTMMLLGLENIREAALFPSDPKRIAGRSFEPENSFKD